GNVLHKDAVTPKHDLPRPNRWGFLRVGFNQYPTYAGTGPAYLRLRSRQTRSCCPMPTIKHFLLGIVLAAGTLFPVQVLADRPPSAEEQSRIEALLRDAGFQQWGKIELNEDDDFWEVEDAYACDGSKYDLKLNLEVLTIIKG